MNARRTALILVALVVAATVVVGGCNAPTSGDEPIRQTSRDASGTLAEPAPESQPQAPPEAWDEEATILGVVNDGWLMGIALPTVVSRVVDRMGDPGAVELPDLEQDPSPWGQFFSWDGGGGLTFRVLGDGYSDRQPDYGATVRVSEIRAGQITQPVEVTHEAIIGQSTRADIERSLGTALEPSDLANRWQFDPGDVYRSSLVYRENDLFTFFMFDEAGVLVGVVQATFDIANSD